MAALPIGARGGLWNHIFVGLAAQSLGRSQRFAAELIALRPDLIPGNGRLVNLVLKGGTGTWSINPDLAYEAHNHFR